MVGELKRSFIPKMMFDCIMKREILWSRSKGRSIFQAHVGWMKELREKWSVVWNTEKANLAESQSLGGGTSFHPRLLILFPSFGSHWDMVYHGWHYNPFPSTVFLEEGSEYCLLLVDALELSLYLSLINTYYPVQILVSITYCTLNHSQGD